MGAESLTVDDSIAERESPRATAVGNTGGSMQRGLERKGRKRGKTGGEQGCIARRLASEDTAEKTGFPICMRLLRLFPPDHRLLDPNAQQQAEANVQTTARSGTVNRAGCGTFTADVEKKCPNVKQSRWRCASSIYSTTA
jgi:hypothetical protein